MPSPIIIEIKIPAYIKSWLIIKSENNDEPMIFRRYDINWESMKMLFTSKQDFQIKHNESTRVDTLKYYSDFSLKYPTFVELQIEARYCEDINIYRRNYISRDNREKLVKIYKTRFFTELDNYVRFRVKDGYCRKDALRMFFDVYKISETDIQLESIYRQLSRQYEFLRKI